MVYRLYTIYYMYISGYEGNNIYPINYKYIYIRITTNLKIFNYT